MHWQSENKEVLITADLCNDVMIEVFLDVGILMRTLGAENTGRKRAVWQQIHLFLSFYLLVYFTEHCLVYRIYYLSK